MAHLCRRRALRAKPKRSLTCPPAIPGNRRDANARRVVLRAGDARSAHAGFHRALPLCVHSGHDTQHSARVCIEEACGFHGCSYPHMQRVRCAAVDPLYDARPLLSCTRIARARRMINVNMPERNAPSVGTATPVRGEAASNRAASARAIDSGYALWESAGSDDPPVSNGPFREKRLGNRGV